MDTPAPQFDTSAIDTSPIRIFAMNDYTEWWIGRGTPEQMRDAYRAEYGDDTMDDDDIPTPLDEAQLDALRYYYGVGEEPFDASKSRTFREQLAIEAATGVEIPRLFAMEEW